MISEEMFWYRVRFGYVGGLVNWSAAFVEVIFIIKSRLLVTAFASNHVDKVFRVAGNVVSDRSCFAVEWDVQEVSPLDM